MKKNIEALISESVEDMKHMSGPRVEILGFPADTDPWSKVSEMGICLPVKMLEALANMSKLLRQSRYSPLQVALNGKDFSEVEILLLHEPLGYVGRNEMVLPESESGLFLSHGEGEDYRCLSRHFQSNLLTPLNKCTRQISPCTGLDIRVSAAGVAFAGHEGSSDFCSTLLLPAERLPEIIALAREAAGLDARGDTGDSLNMFSMS